MERHSRLLLRFVQALSAASEVRTESFVFGTRLTRVTRLLRDRDRDRALARVADSVNDWAGGTRIGESFRTFNQHVGPPVAADVAASSSSCPTAGTAAIPRSSRSRRPASAATAIGSCGSTPWPARPATSHSPAGCAPPIPYIDDFLPAGTVASLERLGEILGGVRAGDTRRGSEAAAHAPCPARNGPAVAGAAVRRRRRDHRPIRSEATSMKELLDTLRRLGVRRHRSRGCRPGGRRPDVRVRAAPEGAVLLYARDGRIAGSVSGGCVEGAAAEEIDRARATGHARVIRYGISDEQAWDVGLACGGTIDVLVEPVAPAVVVDAARGPWGRADTVRPSSRHSPPIRRPGIRAASAGRRRAAGRRARRRRRRHTRGTLGSPELDAELVEAATAALRRGLSRTVELGGRSLFIEVFPVRPRLVIVGGVEVARSLVRLARELGFETVVVDGRAAFATPSGSRMSTDWSSAGPTRSPTRSGSGRTTRSPSCRTTSSSTSRRSSRRCAAAAATSARSARARRRPTGGHGCSKRA